MVLNRSSDFIATHNQHLGPHEINKNLDFEASGSRTRKQRHEMVNVGQRSPHLLVHSGMACMELGSERCYVVKAPILETDRGRRITHRGQGCRYKPSTTNKSPILPLPPVDCVGTEVSPRRSVSLSWERCIHP